ncbi:hypothetical protein O6H91_05G057100 [Diphasiastrum complanatum]|uniref:Uncharacterized protein n=2 Tax=Diphasiastrum complanatum TaxID=34168 RepID=A0ACC2DNA5_DIPCM|nr:hypothetical protein O6H91_05G054600 [Diphasiastrum complanatum]KAJ7555843.1 hypothetical protein O6H91_05G057100 [Diphasiastrum complanatum]
MVGIFSKLSRSRSGQPISVEEKQVSGLVKEPSCALSSNGVDPLEEFVPVEHPMEPRHNDKPIRCPLPEPCIVHDGRIWKERIAANARRLQEYSFLRENSVPIRRRGHTFSHEHVMLPSCSAPEKALLKFLE